MVPSWVDVETADVETNSFVNETGAIDVAGSDMESISCLARSFTKNVR